MSADGAKKSPTRYTKKRGWQQDFSKGLWGDKQLRKARYECTVHPLPLQSFINLNKPMLLIPPTTSIFSSNGGTPSIAPESVSRGAPRWTIPEPAPELVKDEDLLSFLQISQIPTEVVASNQCSDTQLLNVPCRYRYFDQLKGNLETRQFGPRNAGVSNVAQHS